MPKKGFSRDNPYGLSDRQMAFLNEYLVDFNAARASRLLGFDLHSCAEWVKYDKSFQKALDAYLEKIRRENIDLKLITLEELKAVMCSDIVDYATWENGVLMVKDSKSIKNTKAIKSIEQGKYGVKIVLHDKVRGIELMMTGLGMVKRPVEDKPIDPPAPEDEGKGVNLLEALNRAHAERKSLPGMSGGMIAIEQVKENGNG